MSFKDHFSRHASAYARHRPHYPPELFEYLASLVPVHERAWDVGSGNGQAALGLAPYFEHVVATDPSEEQLRNAFRHEKVSYCVALAERSCVRPASVDLVTVAQALHWFDPPRFFEEVRVALKAGGAVAFWAYTLVRIAPELDPIVDEFYWETVGPYWPKERKLVDDGYRSIVLPFDELDTPDFNIELSWNAEDLLSYVRTWSPVRRYIERHGRDPVDLIEQPVREAWGNPDDPKLVRFPIHLRVGRKLPIDIIT